MQIISASRIGEVCAPCDNLLPIYPLLIATSQSVLDTNLPLPPRTVGVGVKETESGKTGRSKEARLQWRIEERVEMMLEQRAGIERWRLAAIIHRLHIGMLRCRWTVRRC